MVRTRLAAAIVGAGMCLPGLVSALGIGDYTLRSYLNQPLELEIELVQPQDLTLEEIVAALAPQEDFDQAGIDRGYLLTDMRFEVVQRNGRLYVVARTRQTIDEPFLNFLLDVRWPQGRMLREYTILLDPPVYKPGAAPTATVEPVVARQEPVAPPATRPSAAPVSASLPPPPSAALKEPASERPSTAKPAPSGAAEPSAVPAEGYRVQDGDTMWNIAARHRAPSSSVQQTMIAIQRANPSAFIDGNVNLVRKGMVLRIPVESEVAQVADADAGKAVSDQTRTWRELLDNRTAVAPPAEGPALDSSRKADAAPAPAKKATGTGQVTLVAPKASGGTNVAQAGKEVESLRDRLSTTEEELSKSTRQNKELNSRLADLDKQVKASDKLLSLKNNEIAELQAELNRLRKEKGLPPVAAAAKEPVAAGHKPGKPDQKPVAAKPGSPADLAPLKESEKPASATGGEKAAEPGAPAGEAPPVAAVEKKKEKPVKEKPAKEKAKPKEKPAPAKPVKSSEGSSFLLPVAGLLAALGIGGGAFWYMRRRRQAASTTPEAFEADEGHDKQIDDDLAQSRELNLGGEEPSAGSDAHASVAGGEGESSDPLGEADMYMAYGRFQQAADILYGALQREPDRDELRVKLAEAYTELGDQASAREQASQLSRAADPGIRAQASALLARLAGAGAASAPGAAAGQAKSAPVEPEKEPSLDDLALEFAGDSQEFKAPAAEAPVFEPMDEFSLDMPEETPVLAKPAPSAKAAAPAETESLDFSLDDADMGDFGLQEEPASAPAASRAAPAPADEMDLAFELDQAMPVEDVTQAAPAVEASLDEFDLGFEDNTATSTQAAVIPDADLDLEEAPSVEVVEVAPAAPPAAALDLQSELADLDADLSSQGVGDQGEAGGDDFDFLADSDENATKLDLAKAYIEMGDSEGARDILNEVIADGSATQKSEAKGLLSQVG